LTRWRWLRCRLFDGDHYRRIADVTDRPATAAENSSINTGRDETRVIGRRPTEGEALGILGANVFRLGQTHRPAVRDIIGLAFSANLVCDAIDDPTFEPSRIVNRFVNEHNFAVGYNGAYIAFSQTYSPLTPPFDWVEFVMPDLP
jgi:hypothetical protein